MGTFYNKRNIIIMSKLAVYDSTESERDFQKNQYFRHDYIYRQNKWVRFFVLIGSLILVGFYVMHITYIDGKDIFRMLATGEYLSELYKIAVFIVFLQVAYTIIGTMIYTVNYERAQKRIDEYYQLVDELEHRNILIARKREEAARARASSGEDSALSSPSASDTSPYAAAARRVRKPLVDDDRDAKDEKTKRKDDDMDAIPEPVNYIPKRPVSVESNKSLVYTKGSPLSGNTSTYSRTKK